MPEQEAAERLRNFSEVTRGYTRDMAVTEARRCLVCKGARAKCVLDCPLGIDIPKFIGQLSSGNFRKAYDTITAQNPLPAICGRVCTQETRCQSRCVAAARGDAISIGYLERFVGDWQLARASGSPDATNARISVRVAILGSGPDCLVCAADLARQGHGVTILEDSGQIATTLTDAIAAFRLPGEVVKAEIDNLRNLGVEFRLRGSEDEESALHEFLERHGYQAAFVGSRPLRAGKLAIPGEDLRGVCTGSEFLTRLNQAGAHKSAGACLPTNSPESIVVAGGGDTAIDCARAALRLGAAEVTVVYRRSLQELTARREEVEHARQEGVQFLLLSTPVRLLGDAEGKLRRVECVETELAGPDETGRARPVSRPGSEFQLAADVFIAAARPGSVAAAEVSANRPENLRIGALRIDPETLQTDIPGVFAIPCTNADLPVTVAMKNGRTAARAIHRYLVDLTLSSGDSAIP